MKKNLSRLFIIFLVVFVLPLSIYGYAAIAPKLSKFAGYAAGLSMGELKQSEPQKTDSSKSEKNTSAKNRNNKKSSSDSSEKSDGTSKTVSQNKKKENTVQPQKSQNAKGIIFEFPDEKVLNAIAYPDKLSAHDGEIQQFTYGKYSATQYFDLKNGGQIRNCTKIPNSELISESDKPVDFEIDKNSDEPQILIYHTHATESFEPYSRDFYDKSFSCKTTDRNMSIISVGDEICRQLDKAGISYVHDILVHDYPSYDNAYDSSRKTVREILAKYPSIKICLDIHRDGIERQDGVRIAPVVNIDGKNAAQIMIISGCDDGTMNMPNFMQNFHFACNLQSSLESDWQGLTRPVLFDYRFYNQDLTNGSLLIEVGSHGNSIDEVRYSGKLIGKTLAEIISGQNN